jgi:hypothetical protein
LPTAFASACFDDSVENCRESKLLGELEDRVAGTAVPRGAVLVGDGEPLTSLVASNLAICWVLLIPGPAAVGFKDTSPRGAEDATGFDTIFVVAVAIGFGILFDIAAADVCGLLGLRWDKLVLLSTKDRVFATAGTASSSFLLLTFDATVSEKSVDTCSCRALNFDGAASGGGSGTSPSEEEEDAEEEESSSAESAAVDKATVLSDRSSAAAACSSS